MSLKILKKANSWEDFNKALIPLPNKAKGDAFELLTKLYFKIIPEYRHYDQIWISNEVPIKVLNHLGLQKQDLGIDLIAKSGDEYHAIQCKFKQDKNKSVTFKEVSTFLSLVSNTPGISHSYICSSCVSTSKNYDKVDPANTSKILGDTFSKLDKNFFDKVRAVLDNKKIEEKAFTPKQHQKDAIAKAYKHFIKENNNRGKLIFPCGSGKSLTGFWIMEKFKVKSTLVAVPSLSLIKQTLEVYLREISAKNQKVKWLCICSDEGIGKGDDVVMYTKDLGVPCKTDPTYIKEWLKKNKDERIIIFTTYQSGRLIADISKQLKIVFDLGIYDEAHKTVGKNENLFSYLLFEKNISVKHRVFMTATERFYRGVKDDVLTMDDPEDYGDVFAKMSFKEAIELDLLTDYKIITIEVKKSEIAGFIKDNNLVEMNQKWTKEVEARSLAAMIALRKAMKRFGIKNAVSFHSSIEKAQRNMDVQQYITSNYGYDPIDTYHVSGKLNTSRRNDIVQEFAKSKKALITNARCLTEGVDVPNIDCIVFADPKKSRVDIVQALGRALRKKEGKKWGYVVLPIIYDKEEHKIDNENFNEIINIVRGLAANDERIIEYFKDKSENKGKVTGAREEIFSIDPELLNEIELTDNLNIKLWEKLSRFNFLPFIEARKLVRTLNLKSYKEYYNLWKEGKLPYNLPVNIYKAYKNSGLISIPDYLGYESLFQEWMPFDKARDFIRKFKFKSQTEFRKARRLGKFPTIPTHPEKIYKNDGFISMPDFLGYESLFQEWMPFDKARDFIRKFKLKSETEFTKAHRLGKFPKTIPASPRNVYKNKGFISMPDFLGYESLFQEWMSYEDHKEIIKPLKLKSIHQYQAYIKKNKIRGLHRYPPKFFEKVWKKNGGWSDFLSKPISHLDKIKKRMPFKKARDFVWKLNLKTGDEWKAYTKSDSFPDFLPMHPGGVYDQWTGIENWIGPSYLKRNERKHLKYRSFNEAKEFVKKQKFKTRTAYTKWKNRPEDIPYKPENIYTNEWKDWFDYLSTESYWAKDKGYLKWDETSKKLVKLKIKSNLQFRILKKAGLPKGIPPNPEGYYRKEWNKKGGWGGLLKTGNSSKRDYIKFLELKKIIKKNNIKSRTEYGNWGKSFTWRIKNRDIPSNPRVVYLRTNEWEDWADFLGKKE